MKNQIIFFCFILSCFGCNSQTEENVEKEEKLLSIRLSPDDTQFLFSYFRNGQGAIYKCEIDGSNMELIAKPKDKETYSHPRYSPNGESVLFISFSEDAQSSAIFIADKTGKNKKQLTEYNQLITEAIFSHDGNSIFYSKAGEIANYSPIAPKAPHKMDVYSIDIKTKLNKQVTHLHAYSIENITAQDSIVMFIQRLEGPYYFNVKEPEKIKTITPKNIEDVKTIGCGGFTIKNDLLYFLTGGAYQLYAMSISEKKAKLVLHNNFQMNNLDVFRNSNKIIFTKNIKDNIVVIYDLNDYTYKEVLIDVY